MNAALAPSAAERPPSRLPLARVGSALALAPPVLAAIWIGWPLFEVMLIGGALLLGREWWRLCGGTSLATAAATMLAVAAGPAVAAVAPLPFALIALAGAAAALVLFASRHPWLPAAPLYLGLPCALLVWLRADPADGRETVLWLFIVVWASDIGAYLAGRLFGGPRLAPRISPGKTWSGAAGGLISAAVAGGLVALAFGHDQVGRAAALAAGFGLIAQLGDLVESWIKRRFGVKDTGTLIPGHGGLLDRVDALLLAALVMGLLALWRDGSIVAWM